MFSAKFVPEDHVDLVQAIKTAIEQRAVDKDLCVKLSEQMQQMAQTIIDAQKKEIEELTIWIAKKSK